MINNTYCIDRLSFYDYYQLVSTNTVAILHTWVWLSGLLSALYGSMTSIVAISDIKYDNVRVTEHAIECNTCYEHWLKLGRDALHLIWVVIKCQTCQYIPFSILSKVHIGLFLQSQLIQLWQALVPLMGAQSC